MIEVARAFTRGGGGVRRVATMLVAAVIAVALVPAATSDASAADPAADPTATAVPVTSVTPTPSASPTPSATPMPATPASGSTPSPTASPSAEPSATPSPSTDPAPAPDPIVVTQGSVSVTRTVVSTTALRVTGTARFVSTGDVDSLADGGLVATVTYVSNGGTRTTTRASATLARDVRGAQTWTVALDRTVANGGRVTVSLGGTAVTARYAKPATSTHDWAPSGDLRATAGTTWTRSVTVSRAYGRDVLLQLRRDGRWVTVARKATRATASDTVTFTFKGGDTRWYANGHDTYGYRVVVPATKVLAGATTRTLTVRPTVAYRARSGYLQPIASVSQPGGGYDLAPGRNGNKVKAVQRRLGLGSRWETMDTTTVDAVRRFQGRHGLRVTGVVDKRTWLAMGLSESSWSSLGSYTHPMVADRSSTRAERIEIMIDVARTYIGAEYVWGGAGRPRDGADCSGMVMQALFAAGMPTAGTDVVRHSGAGFRSTHALYEGDYQHVALSQARRGDLVFFVPNGSRAPGGIYHMGIYLGGGSMIDLTTSTGTAQVRSIHALDSFSDLVPDVVRVFS
ncbi:NlpC/P60 family protein [Demequina soli]|uniref:NlpC/P60 family protein n=1 Tax=Demequina soli TaxID=1638987 RepID=UPI000780D142|nr:NlpC/P60 family protein [Demequina soli]